MEVIPNLNFEFHLPSTSEAIEGAIHGLADIVEHYDLDANDIGPLHVIWQVSFGCWITWSISNWQNLYDRVFFGQLSSFVNTSLLFTQAQTFSKINPLDPFRLTSHQRNWDKHLHFQFYKTSIFEWWNLQLFQKKLFDIQQFGKIGVFVNFAIKKFATSP